MKNTGIFLAVAVILSLSADCDGVPVRRQERIAPEQRNERPQQRQGPFPWYTGYPAMAGYPAVPPFRPVYPAMQYEGGSYYPGLMGLEEPYDYMDLDEIELFRSGQKKQGRKRKPAE